MVFLNILIASCQAACQENRETFRKRKFKRKIEALAWKFSKSSLLSFSWIPAIGRHEYFSFSVSNRLFSNPSPLWRFKTVWA